MEQIDLYFKINYATNFGQSVFICGNITEFGEWNPLKALKMQYNEGKWWSVMVKLDKVQAQIVEYKFIVNDTIPTENPIWERGENRSFDPSILSKRRREYFIEEVWSYRTIKLKLEQELNNPEEFMYVVGSDPQLGNWSTPMKMDENKNNIWSFVLHVDPDIFYIRYYYVIKNEQTQTMIWERGPGRCINSSQLKQSNIILDTALNGSFRRINTNKKYVYYQTKTEYNYQNQGFGFQYYKQFGRYYIIDNTFDSHFIGDKVMDNIIIGPYPQNEEDIKELLRMGVQAILNLQTDYDMNHRGLNWNQIQNLYTQYQMEVVNFQILDMNIEDFIQKGFQAVKCLKQLIKKYEVVYVHCTCGIGRAPSTVVLYLSTYLNYDLDYAIKLVKSRRPQFFINYYMIQTAYQQAKPLISLS